MSSPSDDGRVCIRGCTVKDEHFAVCPDYGKTVAGRLVNGEIVKATCPGCVSRECREGALICDRCFGRMRRLLHDAPDLHARLMSIGDPAKAKPTDQSPNGTAPFDASEPIPLDLLDASQAVSLALSVWWAWDSDLAAISNDKRAVEWMGRMVLDRHPQVDGLRLAWSVQDAVDRWGVERRDRNPMPYEDDEDGEIAAFPVKEWRDPYISRSAAEHVVGSARSLRRWVRNGELAPAGTFWIAGVRTTMFRTSEVIATRDRMQAQQITGRYKRKASS